MVEIVLNVPNFLFKTILLCLICYGWVYRKAKGAKEEKEEKITEKNEIDLSSYE